MFLHQTTVLVYPASIAYDETVTRGVNMRRNTLIKNAISSSPHDSQETTSLNENIERCSVPEDNTSPTPPSQVLAPTSQCDMWLHVAYGV